MLSVLLRSITQAARVLRNFITRPIFMLRSKLYYMTNLGRYLAKIPSLFTALPKALAKKPGKREDYASVGRVFLAKKYIMLIVLAIIILPVLFYIFIWPLIQPLWFTVSYTAGDTRYISYSGKVRIYYDDERESLMFAGRLLDGKYTERGTLYYANGFTQYAGTFKEGVYDEFGSLYTEDGALLYEGGLAMGLYQGSGVLHYSENGAMLYDGEFDKGLYNGQGLMYFSEGGVMYDGNFLVGLYDGYGILNGSPGTLLYKGFFFNGLYHGIGQLHTDTGRLLYSGEFERGNYHGWGELYNSSGVLIYDGEFLRGEKSGFGTEYDDNGNIMYKGGFLDGVYEGQGTLYSEDGSVIYEGGFSGGRYSGDGRLVISGGYTYEGGFHAGGASGTGILTQDSITVYTGEFTDGTAQGFGTLSDRTSGVTFSGMFEDGIIAPGPLFAMEVPDINAAFESGMTELQTETEFYLYSSSFGYVLRFDYATEFTPASLDKIYMHPKVRLPDVGDDTHIAQLAAQRRDTDQYSSGAPRPSERIQNMTGVNLPNTAYPVAEVRGTVQAVLWKTSGTTVQLYVFEPKPPDLGTPLPERGRPEEFASNEYYEKFGLGPLIPEGNQ